MTNKNKIIFYLLFVVCCLSALSRVEGVIPFANATVEFNPNYIISDDEILDYDSMTKDQIQSFLDKKGSYLATYSCLNPDGVEMTAAQAIYDRSQTNRISPKFSLVLIQKEMSLITDTAPTQRQLDFAAGYGCPDGGGCNDRWRGFWKQINSATLQFHSYMAEPHLYTYKAGETYEFTNPYGTISAENVTVTPFNQATASLYNYTPHVYNGNYNFYKLWQEYFSRGAYPNGTLLQAEGEPGVWLLQNGMKRPFLTKGALTSRFDEKKIVIVPKSDLDKYEKGAPIKFPNYSLIRSPRGTIFLLVDDNKRGFDSALAFKNIGYNPEEVMDASWEDINAYVDGKSITASSTYPAGALLQNNKTGGVYWVMEGEKSPITDRVFLTTRFKNKKIIPVTPADLDSFITIDPVSLASGELVKSSNSNSVYLIDNGLKRPFLKGSDFESLGYKWTNIITVSPQLLYLYQEGEPMSIEN